MPLTRRGSKTVTEALTPELRSILLFGPWSVGKTLADVSHDTLRAAWAAHGPSLLAAPDCPRRPWFLERDEFVTFVRRELL